MKAILAFNMYRNQAKDEQFDGAKGKENSIWIWYVVQLST